MFNFSSTFGKLENDSDRIWKNQRYYFIIEYVGLSVIPPPFNILNLIIYFVEFIINKAKQINKSNRKVESEKESTKIDLYCNI